jgi:hypothetical protein
MLVTGVVILRTWLRIVIAFVVAAIVGLIVWILSGSTFATYLVAVLTMAAAIAALFAVNSSHEKRNRIKSRVKVGRAGRSNISGVVRHGQESGDVSSHVKVRKLDDGDVTGVRED